MPKEINFTKTSIDSLPIPESGKRDTYHDIKKPWLQLRVTSTGAKTFCVFKRVKGGNPERITLGRFPELSVEQAKKEAAKIALQMIAGKNPADRLREAKREMTLGDLFQEYMERRAAFNKRPDKPQATYRLYLSEWNNRKLSAIRHEEVDRLHKKIGRNNGQVTANIVLKLLHVMFNKAINEWRIWKGENPAHGIAKFPEQSRDRFLQSDELPRFFKSLAEEPNTTIRDFILISLLTGARRSNVLAMRWQDISFDRHEWRIEVTRNGTPQTVALSPEVIEVLQNRKHCTDAEFVFPGNGKSGHLEEPKKGWQRILERSGIEDLRIHDLRRTLGSWQAKTGASLAIIGKSLNHKNQSTTAIYARLDLDPVRDSVNKATSAMLTAAGLKKSADAVPLKRSKGQK
jgi:integrase